MKIETVVVVLVLGMMIAASGVYIFASGMKITIDTVQTSGIVIDKMFDDGNFYLIMNVSGNYAIFKVTADEYYNIDIGEEFQKEIQVFKDGSQKGILIGSIMVIVGVVIVFASFGRLSTGF